MPRTAATARPALQRLTSDTDDNMPTNLLQPAASAEANDSRTASDKAVVCKELLACPFCDSEKVMAEGSETVMAMVCQKCFARGPMGDVEAGRDAAIAEWNKAMRQPHQKTRYECERCGMTVTLVYYGWLDVRKWKHVGGKSNPKRICCGLPPKVKIKTL